MIQKIWKAVTGEYENRIASLEKANESYKQRCQGWKDDYSELNRDWEKQIYKLCDELEKERIKNSEYTFKVEALTAKLAACQQRLEVNFLNEQN